MSGVSVIIPCYNQSRFLPEAIESALNQSHEPEIIVIDDGSQDATSAVAARYKNVRYVYQMNAGLAEARNRGIRESSGAFLVFLDADDRLLPDALERGVAYLKMHPECAFVFGGFRHVGLDGSPLKMDFIPEDPGSYVTLLRYNHVGCPAAVMYRRTVLDAVGGFDRAFNPAEDYELYLRIAYRFSIRRHPHCVAEYRKYDTSMSGDYARMLSAVRRVQLAQRRRVGSDNERQRALADGLRGNQEHYVELMRGQMTDGRTAGWQRRVRLAGNLLRWDPKGFIKLFAPRSYCRLFQWRDSLRNRLISLRTSTGGSTGSISATPNPIRTSTAQWNGPALTSVAWQASGADGVEVRIDRPDGPLFSACSPSGSASTGEWVWDGTQFYLQAISDTATESRTLAVVTVNVIPE
jgi:glycosyltransferase involved in cell wall biosynthesis